MYSIIFINFSVQARIMNLDIDLDLDLDIRKNNLFAFKCNATLFTVAYFVHKGTLHKYNQTMQRKQKWSL